MLQEEVALWARERQTNTALRKFRRQAVSLADQPGKTAREVADSLGIHVNQIYNWRIQFNKLSKKQFQTLEGVDYSKEELNEIRRLKHENEVLKKEKGLKARNGKNFKYTQNGNAVHNVGEHLLNRDFYAQKPDQKWVSDITYINANGTWLYLAVVMDLYSRAIVGWSLDRQITESLICEALDMALSRRKRSEGLIVHSDRGIQYRSNPYWEKLKSCGCRISMSRKGNCWDNAAVESFFSRFEVECIYSTRYKSIDQAKADIFEYIEIFYNCQRRHSAIGYISPMQFEQLAYN